MAGVEHFKLKVVIFGQFLSYQVQTLYHCQIHELDYACSRKRHLKEDDPSVCPSQAIPPELIKLGTVTASGMEMCRHHVLILY